MTVKEEVDTLVSGIKALLNIQEDETNFMPITDGGAICNTLMYGMIAFNKFADKYKLKAKDYAFCCNIENAGGTMIGFECKCYWDYIKQYGAPYATKDNNRSDMIMRILQDYNTRYEKI